MKRYVAYLFKQFFGTTFFMTLALVGAVWLTQALKYIDFVMARGLSFLTFIKLVSLLLPNLLSIILPISVFLSALFVLNKLYADRELIVLKALGVSNSSIAKPFLILGASTLALVYLMNFHVNPLSNKQYRDYKTALRNNITSFVMQPGEFVTVKNITFYIKSRHRQGQLSGIFVYDARDPEKPFTITAERGLVIEEETGLKLVLFQGTRQDKDRKNGQPNILNFEQYSVEIQNPEYAGDRDPKPSELSLAELQSPPTNASPKLRHKYRIEAHQRILLPLNIIPFMLLALIVFLCGDFNRKGRTRAMVMAGSAAITYEALLLALLNNANQTQWMIPLTYGVFVSTVLLLFLILTGRISLKPWWRT